jgi:hypothetical protein
MYGGIERIEILAAAVHTRSVNRIAATGYSVTPARIVPAVAAGVHAAPARWSIQSAAVHTAIVDTAADIPTGIQLILITTSVHNIFLAEAHVQRIRGSYAPPVISSPSLFSSFFRTYSACFCSSSSCLSSCFCHRRAHLIPAFHELIHFWRHGTSSENTAGASRIRSYPSRRHPS